MRSLSPRSAPLEEPNLSLVQNAVHRNKHMSRDMTKQQRDLAYAQSDQSSLSARRKLGSLATH